MLSHPFPAVLRKHCPEVSIFYYTPNLFLEIIHVFLLENEARFPDSCRDVTGARTYDWNLARHPLNNYPSKLLLHIW